MRFFRIWLVLLAWTVAASAEDPAIVVFSRHTFRGVTLRIGPSRCHLPELGLDLPLPVLGYGMEATEHGLALARDFGAPALQEATATALRTLGQPPAARWDEIRCDLSCSRDFFTGLYFREGLQPGQKSPITITGCPTTEFSGIDAVTIGLPIKKCVPLPELRRLQGSLPAQERLRKAGQELLQLVGPGPFPLPLEVDANGELHAGYDQLWALAGAVEMVSEEGPPLQLLFPRLGLKGDRDAVRLASNFLGLRFTALLPIELARACSQLPLEYIDSTPAGRHVILMSHDDDLSCLMRSLELVRDDAPAEDLAVLPMESLVFALGSDRVCVVRMRMQVAPDGSLPGPFQSSVLWQGSRAEWKARVDRCARLAREWAPGAAERAKIQILPAPTLDVLYRPGR